jgi:carboxypeptidase family protein
MKLRSALVMNLRLAHAAICVAMVLGACPAVVANPQESARTTAVRIQVQDPGSGRIPGAQISIAPLPAGMDPTQTADQTGTLSLQLPPGSYDVTAAFRGFRKTTKHIDVQQGLDQTIEVVLAVAESGPTVIVESSPGVPPDEVLVAPCSSRDLVAVLPPTDPAYNDAAELAHRLDDLGIHIRCTLASKMQRFFAGQIGAALYRTDAGDFEALFLPQSESFGGLRVVERPKQGKYLYSFRGTPHSNAHMDSSKRAYFIKKRNVLFYVWGDDQLAETLRSKLNGHPEV